MRKISSGELPERPKNPALADGLWRLTKRCLERNPRRRPKIAEVTSYLRRILTDRQGRAGVATANDTTLGSTREKELASRLASFVNHLVVTPIGLQDTHSSMHAYQPRRWYGLKNPSPECRYASDGACETKFRRCSQSIRGVELGELDTHEGVQSTPSGSRSLLRRIGFWVLSCGTPRVKDYQDDIPVSPAKHRPHVMINTSKGESFTVNGSGSDSFQRQG